jgi:hypothetical protein
MDEAWAATWGLGVAAGVISIGTLDGATFTLAKQCLRQFEKRDHAFDLEEEIFRRRRRAPGCAAFFADLSAPRRTVVAACRHSPSGRR